MNASRRSDVLRETDHAQEHRASPRRETDSGPFDRQTPPRDLVGPHLPDEGAFETFVAGAGI
jgi:hypothetical protein